MADRKPTYPRSFRLPPAIAAEISKLVEKILDHTDEDVPRAVQAMLSPDVKYASHDDILVIVVDQLLIKLRTANEDVRRKATIALTEIGAAGVNLMACHVTESTDVDYRIRLIGILTEIGPRARKPVAFCLIGNLVNQVNQRIRKAILEGVMHLEATQRRSAGEPAMN
ncbi:MAG: hypothetical protein FJ271_18990 [Planctomycetes bacterium]|nr:hypothetical protein [Planctomycetota bacterium]